MCVCVGVRVCVSIYIYIYISHVAVFVASLRHVLEIR